jgi:serine/threonine protein kinase
MNPAATQVTRPPLSLVRRVDAVCYRFEGAWLDGQRPQIEDYLSGVAEAERAALLEELIILEADYRRRSDEVPDPAEYRARFPTLNADWLARAVAPAPRAVIAVGPAAGGARYHILRPHARGGLGVVYVARDRELRREVALKEILPELAADPHSRRRFLLEAEVTGSLEHPGIVPVYSLGAYEDGRPFYAMRFVQGDSLEEAVRRFHEAEGPGRDLAERGLALRGLLRRFVDVCNAVAYAHSRGILHRDLKPANIMLGTFGETLVVDWGLAKAEGRRQGARAKDQEPGTRRQEAGRSDGSLIADYRQLTPESCLLPTGPAADSPPGLTRTGVAVGTPAYMSPEQAAGRHRDVGPASDVYGLGATLFCLLTGRAPVGGTDIGEALLRVQRGDIPQPREVNRAVPAALEAVCVKAMAMNPADRYATALALAADVEHWLADEPVAVYDEPWPARALRWSRRHRVLVAGTVAALTAAVIILGAAAIRLDAVRQREHRAWFAEAAQRQTAQASVAFLEKLFTEAAHGESPGGPKTATEMLDVATQLAQEMAFDDATRGRLFSVVGQAYLSLGQSAQAVQALGQALALRRATLGPDDPQTLDSMHGLVVACCRSSQFREALPLAEEALARRSAVLGADHLLTLRSQTCLAVAYDETGRKEDAFRLIEDVFQRRKATLGPDHSETVGALWNLLDGFRVTNRPEDGIRVCREMLAYERGKATPDKHYVISLTTWVAGYLLMQCKYAEAEPLWRKVVAFGDEQQPLSWVHYANRSKLGESLAGQKRYAEAEPLLLQGYEGLAAHAPSVPRPNASPYAFELADALNRLVRLYDDWGKPEKAAEWRAK